MVNNFPSQFRGDVLFLEFPYMFRKFCGIFFLFVSKGVPMSVPPIFKSISGQTNVVHTIFVFVWTDVALVDNLVVEAISIKGA